MRLNFYYCPLELELSAFDALRGINDICTKGGNWGTQKTDERRGGCVIATVTKGRGTLTPDI